MTVGVREKAVGGRVVEVDMERISLENTRSAGRTEFESGMLGCLPSMDRTHNWKVTRTANAVGMEEEAGLGGADQV